jgi:F-type H+-transporting ATPase subunit delta
MISEDAVRHETVLDNTGQRVAKVYAEALLRAAAQRGQAADVLEELQALVGEVFRREPALELFLSSPAVGRDRKAAVLRQTFEGRTSDLLLDFLYVLNSHDRLEILRGVAGLYRDLYDRGENRMQVLVRSAVPLADDQRERLTGELRAAFGKEPIVHSSVEPDLLGGLVVQVDDWVYDSSVRTRLDNLRKQLVERSSHAIQSGRDRFSSANGN